MTGCRGGGWLGTLVVAMACVTPAPLLPPASADDLLIVDCRLPPEVRHLGTRITYLTARRTIRTSAHDCALSGGEYAAPRARSRASALGAWLPLAQQGDAQAQNYVGEVYEMGLGDAPDHEAAAVWYQRAAEAGYAPAQVNLGQLYESGNGVARDPARARFWFRQASGLEELGLDYLAAPLQTQEVAELEAELARSARQIDRLRHALEGTSSHLESRLSERDAARRRADALEERLRLRSSELSRIQAELARAQQRAQQTEAALDHASSLERAVRDGQQDLARLRRELEETRRDANAVEERLARIDELEEELGEHRARVARLEEQLGDAQATAALALEDTDVPGPTIQIIEPSGASARGVRVVATGTRWPRLIVGRVSAPAGLLSLLVDGLEREVNARGVFKAEIEESPDDRVLSIVAIDSQGKRAERELRFQGTDRWIGDLPAVSTPPEIDFGRFLALVIGNENYAHLPDLRTAHADARSMAAVLERKYGFEVTRLEDARRYDVLSALNRLRRTLTRKDNLLIYYAGHGELDEVNMRGHWLPVDAEPDSSANWISNIALTDLINSMEARHVIVVADSCYSGSLTRSAMARLETETSEEERRVWFEAMNTKRSRTALTSGGLSPVLDAGGAGHSVFARAVLDVLESNREVLEGQRLYQEVAARVTYAAEQYRFEQLPQYAPIKFSGHESGDFFFVPRS